MNNREAGDSRRHRGHYDVTVMESVESAAVVFFLRQSSWHFQPVMVPVKSVVETETWDETAHLRQNLSTPELDLMLRKSMKCTECSCQ